MIVRIVAVDPRPRKCTEDVVVYQVPEASRSYELLVELLEKEGIDWVKIESSPRRKPQPVDATS